MSPTATHPLGGLWAERRFVRERPEMIPSLVIVAVWALLVLGPPARLLMLRDEAFPDAMTEMVGTKHSGAAVRGLPSWILMTVAMMGPAALAGVRHTAVNSLNRRRGRAMGEFAAGYLAVWSAFGAAVLMVTAFVPPGVAWAATTASLVAASVWQLTPLKRHWLRECHRSHPLPLQGWPAERGSVRFGLYNGLACLGSCWCSMLVMAVLPAAHVPWTAALTVLVTAERLAERPRRVTRFTSLALGLAALGALGVAVAPHSV